MYWLVVSRSSPRDSVVRGAMICAFGSKLAVRTAPAACARNSHPMVPAAGGEPMTLPLAPWVVVVIPDWFSTPRGSGAVPEPRSATRSSSRATWRAKLLAMTPSLLGSASSNSSSDRVMTRVSVRAVNVTRSKVMSAVAVIAEFSVFHPGDPSPVSRASARVWLVMGTVMAPAVNTRVAFLARSMTRADSGEGTFLGRVIPQPGRHAAQVPVERQRLLGLVEHAAGLAPVVHALLAGQHRLPRCGRAWAADGRGAELGDLTVTLRLDAVVDLAQLGRAGLVFGELLAGQVAGFDPGAFEDRVGSLTGGRALRAELLQKGRHRFSYGSACRLGVSVSRFADGVSGT